jgi:hypothetical protein
MPGRKHKFHEKIVNVSPSKTNDSTINDLNDTEGEEISNKAFKKMTRMTNEFKEKMYKQVH